MCIYPAAIPISFAGLLVGAGTAIESRNAFQSVTASAAEVTRATMSRPIAMSTRSALDIIPPDGRIERWKRGGRGLSLNRRQVHQFFFGRDQIAPGREWSRRSLLPDAVCSKCSRLPPGWILASKVCYLAQQGNRTRVGGFRTT